MDSKEGKAVRGRVPKRQGGEPTAVSMTEAVAPPPEGMVKSGARPNEMTHEELLAAAKEYARLLLAEHHEKHRLDEKLRGARSQRGPLDDDEGFQEPDLAGSGGPSEPGVVRKYPVRTAAGAGVGINLVLFAAINGQYVQLYGENMPVWLFAAILVFMALQALLVWLASNKVTANAVLERLRG